MFLCSWALSNFFESRESLVVLSFFFFLPCLLLTAAIYLVRIFSFLFSIASLLSFLSRVLQSRSAVFICLNNKLSITQICICQIYQNRYNT